MKQRVLVLFLLASLSAVSGLAHADKLDDIQKAGVVRIAVFDSNPPFGYVDPQTKKLVGYDVQYQLDGKIGQVRMDHDPGQRIPLSDSGQLILSQQTAAPPAQ